MRTPLDALVTKHTLQRIAVATNSGLIDYLDNGRTEHNVPLKNVCAKVLPELAEEIDSVVGLLGVSKRQFLEAAFIEAIFRAKAIIDQEGLWDVYGNDDCEHLKPLPTNGEAA
jgi:hypothetical protein